MAKTKSYQPYSVIPRRTFISTAVLATSALVPDTYGSTLSEPTRSAQASSVLEYVGAQASFGQISAETILLPTPTDALIDLLVDLSRVNMSILEEYYFIITILARQSSNKYAELRRAVIELQQLVPALKVNTDVSHIRDFTDIGIAGVRSISASASARTTPNTGQTRLLTISLSNLDQSAEHLNQQEGTLTLSPAAVEKLREVLRRILELAKPNENLKAASDALGLALKDINPQIQEAQSYVVKALKTLAQGEEKEFTQFTTSQPNNSEVAFIADLRRQAAADIRTAAVKVRSMKRHEPPLNLRQLAEAATDPTSPPLPRTRALSIDLVADLFDGCASWIGKRYALSERRNFENDNEVRFIRASYVQLEAWTRLWGRISDVLKGVLPQASTPRIRKLYWRKMCMSVYDASKQEAILYNYLPDLPPVGETNLFDNDAARRAAAQKLSVL